jgi:hypothetical protein
MYLSRRVSAYYIQDSGFYPYPAPYTKKRKEGRKEGRREGRKGGREGGRGGGKNFHGHNLICSAGKQMCIKLC